MPAKKLEKLADLFGKDLAGWQVGYGYFLELKHGLMGTFPAILTKTQEQIIVFKKDLLRAVWNALPRREAKVTHFLALAHPAIGLAFSLEEYDKSAAKRFHLFREEEIAALCGQEKPFRWAQGLFSLSDHVFSDPSFV